MVAAERSAHDESVSRLVRLGGICAALALGAGAALASPTPLLEAAVGCEETTTARVRGNRILLGAVVLPRAAELARPARPARSAALPYVRSALIAIRAGEPDVSVTIPEGWRHRVALSWGRDGNTSSVRFARCGGSATGWSVYAGGFRLSERGDCVPLVVRAGGTATTVRLGVGRECGARRR